MSYLYSGYCSANSWFPRIFLLGIIVLLLSFINESAAKDKKSVLFISSYHPAFPTFFQQIEGLNSVLTKDVFLDVEFMDTKRYPQKENWDNFQKSLSYKLNHGRDYSVIIVADDNALIFALDQQNNLFKNIPIVFFGVNDIEKAIAQNSNPQVTGVVEAVSMEETIKLMIELCPKARRIVSISDNTPSGQGDLKSFYRASNQFTEHRFTDISLADMSWLDFLKKLEDLNEESCVLLLSAYKDNQNQFYLFDESLSLIRKYLKTPLFHLWYHGFGDGVLGGKVICHFEQGKVAAEIVLEILNGTPVSEIPVINSSPNRYVFDYTELKKYAISNTQLPENSLVLNQPYSFYQTNKKLIWLISTVIFVLLLALFSSIANILRRRQIETQLKNRELQLRTIIGTIPDLVWLKDPDGAYLLCNPKFERFFGAQEKDIIGKTDYDFFDKERAEFFRKNDQRAVLAGKPRVNEENVVYADDGHQETLETIKTPLYDSDGNLTGVLGISRDITARKKTETELLASEEKFAKAFKNAPLLMTISSLDDGRYVDVNEAFNSVTQYTRDTAIGSTSVEIGFISQEDRDFLKQELREKNFIHEVELKLTKADGTRMYCLYSGEIITIAGQKRLLSLAMDITERKIIEQRLLQAQKMESIGNLAGGIAHDFNNLLCPIIGMSEMLLSDLPQNSLEHENAKEIFLAGKRAGELVNQILTFSRQSEHKMIPVRVPDVLTEVLKLCHATIPTNIKIHEDIQRNCGLIMADPTQIHQVAMNLITNALHAVENNNGEIVVELKEIPHNEFLGRPCLKLSISDTGIGIPHDIIKRIFDPYFTTKKQGKGTGLGLAVVYGIIKEHNGEIKVHSEVGKGTTFNVYLPLMKKSMEKVNIEAVQETETGNEKILLVDDEPAVAKLEGRMLSRLGYQVTVKTCSTDALATFRENPDGFDLVISDMAMPELTGAQLTKEMLLINPGIPIIICTGFSEQINNDRISDIGVRGLLMKPVLKSDMAKMVRKVLDDAKNES